ncbi:MAG TPA: hypothetical protein PLO37_25840 [Candidatus Hydrogenedentes bacterium]|nr:hypothetical protein [Candidatus Hydrogenedentota bacterium]
MSNQLLVPLLISTLVAILGWIVGHKLNARRDRINKHREMRLQYLVSAYQKLTNSAGKEIKSGSDEARWQAEAVSDIQLLGTQQQIDCLLAAMVPGGDINPVINLLGNELRDELGLPPIPHNVRWVRY